MPSLFPRRYGTLNASQFLVKLPGSLYPQVAKTNVPYTYAAPVVTAISQPPSIFGQSTLVVNGSNFGPVGAPISPNVSITVVTSNISIKDCYVKAAHVSIACTVTCFSPCTANYAGGTLRTNSSVTVSLNGLNGTSSSPILAFEGPVINGIRGSTTQLVSLLERGAVSRFSGSKSPLLPTRAPWDVSVTLYWL